MAVQTHQRMPSKPLLGFFWILLPRHDEHQPPVSAVPICSGNHRTLLTFATTLAAFSARGSILDANKAYSQVNLGCHDEFHPLPSVERRITSLRAADWHAVWPLAHASKTLAEQFGPGRRVSGAPFCKQSLPLNMGGCDHIDTCSQVQAYLSKHGCL